MSEETKEVTIADDGKSYAVSNEKGFDRLLAFFKTSYLEHVDTNIRVFDSTSLVHGGTYKATADTGNTLTAENGQNQDETNEKRPAEESAGLGMTKQGERSKRKLRLKMMQSS